MVNRELNIQFFGEPEGGPSDVEQVVDQVDDQEVEPEREKSASVPKYRFDEMSQRAKQAESRVAELTAKLEEAAEKDRKIEELTKELENTKAGFEVEKMTTKKQNAIEAALRGKVVDLEVATKLLDMDKITFDSKGQIKGLEEQVRALRKNKPYLWKPTKRIIEPSARTRTPVEKSFAQKLAEKRRTQDEVVNKGKTYF